MFPCSFFNLKKKKKIVGAGNSQKMMQRLSWYRYWMWLHFVIFRVWCIEILNQRWNAYHVFLFIQLYHDMSTRRLSFLIITKCRNCMCGWSYWFESFLDLKLACWVVWIFLVVDLVVPLSIIVLFGLRIAKLGLVITATPFFPKD